MSEKQDWKEFAQKMAPQVGTFYILDSDHMASEARSPLHWAIWFGNYDRRIVGKESFGPYKISTVFLGFNHNPIPEGKLVLFETMIWEDGKDGHIEREQYETWKMADLGHQKFVTDFRKKLDMK